ncbi:hypothetical protein D4R78_03050 [bacterium]|nr:MAG: hypothetical protein D4R78_03050 [bacterium]
MIFSQFSNYKAQYEKAQTFPFLIAILCVVLIMVMITVNLGQLGVYKTDVSVAADAGALAGASALSSTLLGVGLASESMCGFFYVELIVAILCAATIIGIIVAIIILIAMVIKNLIDYFEACGNARMGVYAAKRTAMQYAFQNMTIDEPRPTFKQFLYNVYGLSTDGLDPNQIRAYNDIYTKGDDPNADSDTRLRIKRWTQSGFSYFMADSSDNGFWKWGNPDPSRSVPGEVTSGYGWGQDEIGSILSSYRNGSDYKGYDNWVEVTVKSRKKFELLPYSIAEWDISVLFDYLSDWIRGMDWGWWDWLKEVLAFILIDLPLLIMKLSLMLIIIGVSTATGDMKLISDNFPMKVTVTRYRKENNLGLWNFRYGAVTSRAMGHAFVVDTVNGSSTIEPTSDLIGVGMQWIEDCLSGSGDCDEFSYMKTELHLFETKLTPGFN